MTIIIAPPRAEEIIDFMSVAIPLPDDERKALAALRNDGDPVLYQGQSVVRFYENTPEIISLPQGLINKTHKPLETLLRLIFVPALPERLNELSAASTADLYDHLFQIFYGQTEYVTAALDPSQKVQPSTVARLLTYSMGEVTEAVKKAVTTCQTRDMDARIRVLDQIENIQTDALGFELNVMSGGKLIGKAFQKIEAFTAAAMRHFFIEARSEFYKRYGDKLHTHCPAYIPMMSGMFGHDFSSIVKLSDRLQKLSEELGLADDATKTLPGNPAARGRLRELAT